MGEARIHRGEGAIPWRVMWPHASHLLSTNQVAVSCARINTFEIAEECIKMFGVSDIAEAVATRKDRFIKRYVANSCTVCEIFSAVVK